MKRARGLRALVGQAVDHGSRAIEHVQIETAKLPFDIVEQIPGLKVPASGVRVLYNTGVSGVHGMIRLANKVVGDTIDVVLDTVEKRAATDGDEARSSPGPTEP